MELKHQCFKEHINPWFVETGSYMGNAIQAALDCGFANIISIDIDQQNYDQCVERFKDYPNVKMILGDSALCLFEAVCHIEEPITFWLDAHYSGEETPYGLVKNPLLYELQQIVMGRAFRDTIIIDDIRLLYGPSPDRDFSFSHLNAYLRYINIDFKITYADGTEPGDVLIATP
jgi:hypothetical protein